MEQVLAIHPHHAVGEDDAGFRRVQTQGVFHPVGHAVAGRGGIGGGVGIGNRAKVLDLPGVGQAVVIGVADEVGNGGLEHAYRVSRIMNASFSSI